MLWMLSLPSALVAGLAVAAFAALVLVLRHRRRPAPGARTPLNVGARHLVSHVGALSDLGRGLPVPDHRPRRRIGSLVTVR